MQAKISIAVLLLVILTSSCWGAEALLELHGPCGGGKCDVRHHGSSESSSAMEPQQVSKGLTRAQALAQPAGTIEVAASHVGPPVQVQDQDVHPAAKDQDEELNDYHDPVTRIMLQNLIKNPGDGHALLSDAKRSGIISDRDLISAANAKSTERYSGKPIGGGSLRVGGREKLPVQEAILAVEKYITERLADFDRTRPTAEGAAQTRASLPTGWR